MWILTLVICVSWLQVQALPKHLYGYDGKSHTYWNTWKTESTRYTNPHSSMERVLNMKNPDIQTLGSKNDFSKYETMYEIDVKRGKVSNSDASEMSEQELEGRQLKESALKEGIYMIESANYDCKFNKSDGTIICKSMEEKHTLENSSTEKLKVEDKIERVTPYTEMDLNSEIKFPTDTNFANILNEDIAGNILNEDIADISDIIDFRSWTEEMPKTLNSNFTSFIFNPMAQPEQKFQNCTTPMNETGQCRYIQHCMISSIFGNINQFMQYVCIIEGGFIGVCCPELPVSTVNVEWPDHNQTDTTEFTNTTNSNEECGMVTNARIVGGSNAERNSWPWMVALLAKNKEAFFCGGALINNLFVLTAAHCTFGIPQNQITARVGEYDLKAEVHLIHEDYAVVQIKRHGQYSQRTLRNDIALLRLEKPVVFNNFIMTICLPERDADFVDKTATLAGWGNLEGGGPTSDVLQVASFPIISNDDCQQGHGIPIDDSTICSGSEDKGACNGDSGGPLMLLDDDDRWKIVALVSWGRRGCNPKFPTVYTRVSHYMDWIETHSSLNGTA